MCVAWVTQGSGQAVGCPQHVVSASPEVRETSSAQGRGQHVAVHWLKVPWVLQHIQAAPSWARQARR